MLPFLYKYTKHRNKDGRKYVKILVVEDLNRHFSSDDIEVPTEMAVIRKMTNNNCW